MQRCVVRGALLSLILAIYSCSEGDPDGAPDAGDRVTDASRDTSDGSTHHGSATPFDPIFDDGGNLDCDAYRQVALAEDLAAIDRRFGPGWAHFHDQAAELETVCSGPADGTYRHDADGATACSPGATDWTGFAGQVLYVPDDDSNLGVDRSRLIWSEHSGHGGAEYWHCYRLLPIVESVDGDTASWLATSPDPGPLQEDWVAANGGTPPRLPVAAGRAHVSWSNVGIVAYRNGFIGGTGYGNNDDRYPFTSLGPNKVPTSVAVTPNNELALITVWDTESCRGQLAVVALEARALAHHSWHYAGLPNVGTYTRLKLLGFVDLPMAAPSSVAASVDIGRWDWTSRIAEERLDSQETRDAWANSVDRDHTAARAGYAVVASRAENRVVFVDLEPLLSYFRSMYFTTAENFEQTTNEGDAPDEWPFAFSVAPEARPVVAAELEVPHPTVVAAGIDVGDRHFLNPDFVSRAYVGTLEGELRIYDVGGLNEAGDETAVTASSTQPLCNNPTDVSYGRGNPTRDELAFVCRGDRAVRFVDPDGREIRTLTDERLVDPVSLFVSDTRGAAVVSVGDFTGRKVSNYLFAPISAWGDEVYGGLCDGGEFEHTGSLERPGAVFQLSAAEVN